MSSGERECADARRRAAKIVGLHAVDGRGEWAERVRSGGRGGRRGGGGRRRRRRQPTNCKIFVLGTVNRRLQLTIDARPMRSVCNFHVSIGSNNQRASPSKILKQRANKKKCTSACPLKLPSFDAAVNHNFIIALVLAANKILYQKNVGRNHKNRHSSPSHARISMRVQSCENASARARWLADAKSSRLVDSKLRSIRTNFVLRQADFRQFCIAKSISVCARARTISAVAADFLSIAEKCCLLHKRDNNREVGGDCRALECDEYELGGYETRVKKL